MKTIITLITLLTLITSVSSVSPAFAHNVTVNPGDNCPSGHFEDPPFSNFCIHPSSGGTGGVNIGKIDSGALPTIQGNENTFVAGVVRNGLQLLIIIAFIIDLIWTILAGFQFIFAGGDPKNISTAWSRIYWGLIGMAIIMASFAIIRIVELFFGFNIISNGLSLPRI